MTLKIRKYVVYDEETLIEGFRKAETPLRMFAVAAVIAVSYTHLTLPTKA